MIERPDIETASDAYASRFRGNAGRFFLDVQYHIVLNMVKECGNAINILDVGGGHGQLAVPLIRDGYRVTVTGSSNLCRDRLDRLLPADTFDYVTCELSKLPFSDNRFDIVTGFRLLPHLENWQTLLAEMCRVAVERVIFDYPDHRSFNFFYGSLFQAKKAFEKNTRPFRLFKRSEILSSVIGQGCSDVRLVPQFFLPMVVHRMFNFAFVSRFAEATARATGLTRFFGSPVIVDVRKKRPSGP